MITLLRKIARFIKYRVFHCDPLNKLDERISVGVCTYGIHKDTVLLYKDNDRVIVGKYCSVAPQVHIIASGEHNFKAVSTFPFHAYLLGNGPEADTFSKGPVTIGNDVWIGHGATIMSGVTIGDGAVIAAHAVITKDIPPYAIAGGIPGKILRYRFEPAVIQSLLEIKWWNWSQDVIKARMDDFYSDIHLFIEKYKGLDK